MLLPEPTLQAVTVAVTKGSTEPTLQHRRQSLFKVPIPSSKAAWTRHDTGSKSHSLWSLRLSMHRSGCASKYSCALWLIDMLSMMYLSSLKSLLHFAV